MENPNRPVTGYPAPNQNGGAYSGNPPPPPASGYPYHNPYYQHQTYQPDREALQRATCLRRIFAFVIGLVVIFGTVTFIVWLVLRPQLPEFRLDSFSLSNFTVTNDSLISLTSEIRLTARNPNKKMKLVYDRVDAGVYYRVQQVSRTVLPPFSQETRNETSLAASFVAAGSFLERQEAEAVRGEIGKSSSVGFNFRMSSSVRFEAKAWKTRRRFLKVFCGDLTVGIPVNGKPGVMKNGPRQCRVGI